jgi:hypothetical protein
MSSNRIIRRQEIVNRADGSRISTYSDATASGTYTMTGRDPVYDVAGPVEGDGLGADFGVVTQSLPRVARAPGHPKEFHRLFIGALLLDQHAVGDQRVPDLPDRERQLSPVAHKDPGPRPSKAHTYRHGASTAADIHETAGSPRHASPSGSGRLSVPFQDPATDRAAATSPCHGCPTETTVPRLRPLSVPGRHAHEALAAQPGQSALRCRVRDTQCLGAHPWQ